MSQQLSYDDGDVSMEGAEQGLHSIPEVDEQLLDDPPLQQQPQRLRSRTPAPRSQTPTSVFSIGGLLGRIVHYIIKVFISLFSTIVSFLSLLAFICGHVVGTMYDIILRRPGNWLSGIGPRSSSFMKYLVLGLTVFGSWYTLRGSLPSYLPNLSFPSRLDVYQAPEVPAGNIVELAERLRRMESVVSGLSADADRTSGREYSELWGRLSALEARFTETKKVLEADVKARDLAGRSLNGVKQDMEILQSQIMAQQVQHEKEQGERTADASSAEARVKLIALEERVGTVERGVKDALDLGKKPSSTPTAPDPASAWWNKLLTSTNSKIQIKSSDGQDITALIHHLVDSAASAISQDILAKPDFALHSGGARIIPSLTSPTFEIRPRGLGSQMIGLVTGNGYAIGRPPITALHHEMQNGHCWPFAGGEGQLGVALASPIFMEEVTIDHVAKSIAFDMRSAPRQMEVWGLVEGKDNIARVRAWKEDQAARKEAKQPTLDGEDEFTTYDHDGSDGSNGYEVDYPKTLPKYPEYIRLSNFTYNIHSSSNVQTFPVMPEIRELGIDFGIVVLRVLNNWGRDDFTCLYRFRVHGQRIGEIPAPYSEDVHGP
jgi:SUN domain-containing protein 1/2